MIYKASGINDFDKRSIEEFLEKIGGGGYSSICPWKLKCNYTAFERDLIMAREYWDIAELLRP